MHHERMKFAIEIIRSVPDHQVDLAGWQMSRAVILKPEGKTCNTICCAAGWIALDPEMQAQGMSVSSFSGGPRFKMGFGYDALAEFFEIPVNDATVLFSPRLAREFKQHESLSDRELWLLRMEQYTANPMQFMVNDRVSL
jgi:hypothetical protein